MYLYKCVLKPSHSPYHVQPRQKNNRPAVSETLIKSSYFSSLCALLSASCRSCTPSTPTSTPSLSVYTSAEQVIKILHGIADSFKLKFIELPVTPDEFEKDADAVEDCNTESGWSKPIKIKGKDVILPMAIPCLIDAMLLVGYVFNCIF